MDWGLFFCCIIKIMKLTISSLALILANTIPIFGVIFFGWDLFQIIFLYWLESGVIGFYNIIKMIVISPKASLFFVPFFIFHYGMFMAVHLFFIIFLFSPQQPLTSFMILSPFIALIVSHGVSFLGNFVRGKEYQNAVLVVNQMIAPYIRIFLMQFTLIFGGIISLTLGTPVTALVILIGLKTLVDLLFHLREHKQTPIFTLS